jgi:hypothetical protein
MAAYQCHAQSILDDTPTAVLVRQVLGAIAQFDQATIVAKLKAARATGKSRRQAAAKSNSR